MRDADDTTTGVLFTDVDDRPPPGRHRRRGGRHTRREVGVWVFAVMIVLPVLAGLAAAALISSYL